MTEMNKTEQELSSGLSDLAVKLAAAGDRVRLVKDIYDDGEDHHPPGYCARRDEIVIVRVVREKAIAVSHESVTDSAFVIYPGEFEAHNV
jgi:hypothetical protein